MAQNYKLTEEQRKLLSRKNVREEKKEHEKYDEWLYLEILACAKKYFDPKIDDYSKNIPMEYRILFSVLERGLTQDYTDDNGESKVRFLWKVKDEENEKKNILVSAEKSRKGAVTFTIKRPLKNFVEEIKPDPAKLDYDIKDGKVGHYEYTYIDDKIVVDAKAYKNYYLHFKEFIAEQVKKEEESVIHEEKGC